MPTHLIQPYNPAWPAHFQQIKTFLQPVLTNIPCSFEHIGSTAIPGMAAKPIIDIDIVIDFTDFPKVKQQLQSLSYIYQGDLGLPKREAFDLTGTKAKSSLPEHHLYVCQAGCHELRKHLAFRDFMKQHPDWITKLNKHKHNLCTKHNNDRQAYIDGKATMVQQITTLAMNQHP